MPDCCGYGNERSDFTKCGEFLEYLIDSLGLHTRSINLSVSADITVQLIDRYGI